MAETILSPDIKPESPEQFELVDDMTQAHIPSMARGVVQRASFGDPRWRVKRRYRVRTSDKAKLMALLQNAQGRYATVRATPGFVQRGSFPATELFTNNDFSNGTTGWTTDAHGTITVQDRVMRLTTVTPLYPEFFQSVASVQYAPYALRSFVMDGRESSGLTAGNSISDGTLQADTYSTARGLKTSMQVAISASSTARYPLVITSASGFTAGAYMEVPWTSYARCLLVDNGPNYLLYSDDLTNAAWTKSGTTVTANYYTAPDGTATADRLIEDTSTGEHYALQSATRTSAIADWCFAVAVCRGDVGSLRDRVYLRVTDSGSTNIGSATFDLSAGTIAVAAAAGGSATNARAYVRDMGNGWIYCCLIVRLPASDTSVRGIINLVENPTTTSYTGASSRNVGVWRATLAQSSVPVRLSATTSAAVPSGTVQTGSSLYVKGGPVSTLGSLLSPDFVEVGGELKQITAALDFDAAGLGYMQFRPGLFRSPADNDPVIVDNPMGRFTVSDIRWDNLYGLYNDLSLTLDEVYE